MKGSFGRGRADTPLFAWCNNKGVVAIPWDVFFSYRRHDLDRARPLLKTLADAGVSVWRDESDVPEQASITTGIRHGIANAKAFLAFFSRTYPESNVCQQEITIAWLAAQQLDPNANRRIWIVNPENSFDHIPELLRDQRIPLIATAQGVEERLEALGTTLLGDGVRDCLRTMA